VLRQIRLGMAGAGMLVEDSKGECNFGQHEVNFRYQEALRMADDHVVYRNGAKEIAFLHGKALTFMPKYDEREGNSCHVHLSLWKGSESLFPAEGGDGMSELFRQFIAGLVRHTRELTLLLAPNVNSYKRFVRGSFAPTALVWGHDNRTCALRVVGHGKGMRVESRVAGGDVNPYLAFAALLAAGLAGIDGNYELGAAWTGSGYDARDEPHVPSTLHEARELFAGSDLARRALGAEVVDHYLNAATVELDAFDAAVTDWELRRSFERL
jgi:glutamine synthetase